MNGHSSYALWRPGNTFTDTGCRYNEDTVIDQDLETPEMTTKAEGVVSHTWRLTFRSTPLVTYLIHLFIHSNVDLYTHVHSSIIPTSQEVEATQRPMSNR